MAAYPFLVQTAWHTLNELLEQWKLNPFRWSREVEIQAELGGRLSQVFALQGLGTVTGSYDHGLPDHDDIQTWNRVGYEPYVPVRYNDKWTYCHPDVVIWGDAKARAAPDCSQNPTWPIAWACELKFGSADKGDWDVEKLTSLVNDHRVEYGCAVNVHFSPATGKLDHVWEQRKLKTQLWVCDVWIPRAQARKEP